ncbi:MAG: glycerophosphoryl diester phosphodiesterase [Frankiales bacterium]|nr:glycerophosphoryl diester phosphodiesterase [Frankiales bacterium]
MATAFLDAPRPIAVAHRGGAAEAPENSLAAFAHAVSLGYSYLETDVHVTADGVLVALHDPTLDRVTDRRGAVRALPWKTVQQAKIAGVEPIPTLDQLFEEFPDVRWTVDAKHASAVDPLIEVIRRHRAQQRVCVGAFSDRRLARLRAGLGPEVCSALGPREVARLALAARRRDPVAALRAVVPLGAAVVPVGLGPLPLVSARFVAAARAAGLAVLVWTVNDATAIERLLDLGVDGVMTDETVLLRDILRRRGQWTAGPQS